MFYRIFPVHVAQPAASIQSSSFDVGCFECKHITVLDVIFIAVL
jgi:hypothetical protein